MRTQNARRIGVPCRHCDEGRFETGFGILDREGGGLLDGHVSAFAFFGGVPLSILYDNLKLAVARILGDGKRVRTRVFTELQSHYLFADRFGRPGKGNDKGKVEGLVKYARLNFLTPVPVVASFETLNAIFWPAVASAERRAARPWRDDRRPDGVIWPPFRSRAPTVRACDKKPARVIAFAGALSAQRLLGADPVRPPRGAGQGLRRCGGDLPCGDGGDRPSCAVLPAADFVFDPLHYLALLERKTGALDQAAPLQAGICPPNSPPCGGCWKRGWRSAAGASSSRCCG